MLSRLAPVGGTAPPPACRLRGVTAAAPRSMPRSVAAPAAAAAAAPCIGFVKYQGLGNDFILVRR